MNDKEGDRIQSREPENGDGETLSGRAILAILTLIALTCVGGYFLILKMIDISKQEDCILAQRRNCAPSEPFRR
jgi:hypothetical protein